VSKSPEEERALILSHPAKRPYGARIRVHLQTAASIGHLEGVCLPLQTGTFVTLSRRAKAPWEAGDRFALDLEGFPTASDAERAGRRLAGALLWTAIKLRFPLRIEYQTYEPSMVYERQRGGGASLTAFATTGWSSEAFLDQLRRAYATLPETDPQVLLSMEIFAGAKVETSERARFLACVSALEPLAAEQPLSSDVADFVDDCLRHLREKLPDESAVRASLEGRLHNLRRESIRQATKRVVAETLPHDTVAVSAVDYAYRLRSQIIHSGRPEDLDTDLHAEGERVSCSPVQDVRPTSRPTID